MVSQKEGLRFLMQKDTKSDLQTLNRQLNNVKNKSGFFNIAYLKKQGFIKKHVTKKGEMRQGQITGQKSHYVLTEKGRRINATISQLY